MSNLFLSPHPLYAICDEETCRRQGIDSLQFYKKLLAGGVNLVQYRNKISSPQEVYNRLKEFQKNSSSSVWLIANDFFEIALELNLGLHVGQEDLVPPQEFQNGWGFSTHNLNEIQKALKKNADYIGFGTMFASPTKPHVQPADISIAIKHWQKEIVFIGGISLDNISLLQKKIQKHQQNLQRFYYAIISDFFRYGKTSKDIQRYIQDFLLLVNKN